MNALRPTSKLKSFTQMEEVPNEKWHRIAIRTGLGCSVMFLGLIVMIFSMWIILDTGEIGIIIVAIGAVGTLIALGGAKYMSNQMLSGAFKSMVEIVARIKNIFSKKEEGSE